MSPSSASPSSAQLGCICRIRGVPTFLVRTAEGWTIRASTLALDPDLLNACWPNLGAARRELTLAIDLALGATGPVGEA